jgi:hypothetical protein
VGTFRNIADSKKSEKLFFSTLNKDKFLAYKKGVVSYLTKPIEKDMLIDKI